MPDERRIARLITTDIIIDIIMFLLNIFAVRYFAKRTVPTLDLQFHETLARERQVSDELRDKKADNETTILLLDERNVELNKRLKDMTDENERLRGLLNTGKAP